MTEFDLLAIEQSYSESKIQHTCVMWFRKTFPELSRLLFSIPNGGWRGTRAGAIMNYEGQVRGVADLILLECTDGRSPLCIEMKVPKKKGSSAGKLSDHQKVWGETAAAHGCRYVVCHGLMEFIQAVTTHLSLNKESHKTDALNKYPLYL